jgi:hypothetical protein
MNRNMAAVVEVVVEADRDVVRDGALAKLLNPRGM